MHDPLALRASILHTLRAKCPSGADFWLDGSETSTAIPQDHADIVYSLYLLGETRRIAPSSAERFFAMLSALRLAGRHGGVSDANSSANVHLTAYLLGAVRLLEAAGVARAPDDLYRGWSALELLDARGLPKWPSAWAHHVWRASHWIGGIPSILLHLARSERHTEVTETDVQDVLDKCEQFIIEPGSGMLRPYRSEGLQRLFKFAYRIRHDPEMGAAGGVAHLLWVYHATGRPYLAAAPLQQRATKLLQRTPFMEVMPYCLDFDIVQLARTAQHQTGYVDSFIAGRASQLADDIVSFLSAPPPPSYTLHKLPGALATLHECATILGRGRVNSLGVETCDIIQQAFWL